jgi:hypothetical protein
MKKIGLLLMLMGAQVLQSAQSLESNICNIPEEFTKHILGVFAHHGFTNVSLECTDIEDGSTTPSFRLARVQSGDRMFLQMNEQARLIFSGKGVAYPVASPEEEAYLVNLGGQAYDYNGERVVGFFAGDGYFSAIQMLGCAYHELGHAVFDHRKKRKTTDKIAQGIGVASGIGVCAVMAACACRLSDSSVIKVGGIAAGLYGGFASYSKAVHLLKHFFWRQREREADQFVFDFNVEAITQAQKEYFQKTIIFDEYFQKYKGASKSTSDWWNDTHPSNEERLAACDIALEKLKHGRK